MNKQLPRQDGTPAQVYESWKAGIHDTNQWFQVSFFTPKDVTAIATQGRPGAGQWVTTYRILYTMDGITWLSYDYDRAFIANKDDSSIVTNQLRTPLRARAIRINPLTWNSYISMSAEVYILSDQ